MINLPLPCGPLRIESRSTINLVFHYLLQSDFPQVSAVQVGALPGEDAVERLGELPAGAPFQAGAGPWSSRA